MIRVHAKRSAISRYAFESCKLEPIEYLGKDNTSAAAMTFHDNPKAVERPAFIYGSDEGRYTPLKTSKFDI